MEHGLIRVRDFARNTKARLHGGTGEEPAPTGVFLEDKDHFCKVLLQELCTERGVNIFFMSSKEEAAMAKSSDTQL